MFNLKEKKLDIGVLLIILSLTYNKKINNIKQIKNVIQNKEFATSFELDKIKQ